MYSSNQCNTLSSEEYIVANMVLFLCLLYYIDSGLHNIEECTDMLIHMIDL